MSPVVRTFRVGRCLGRGGFGEVYRALMVSPSGLSTEVALKVLRSDVQLAPIAVTRLRDEGRLLARIRHPVVVGAYDLTRIDGRIGLVTEFVDGDDLDRCYHEPGRITPRPLLSALGQVAAALDAAYCTPGPDGTPMAIVHRDLKPPNVRIGRHGQVKLLDFGIARFRIADDADRPPTDVVFGSVPYMAPERFGERASLAGGDVYGLGCCLFEGLVGERFHPDGAMHTVATIALDPRAFERHRDRRLTRLTGPPDLVELVAGTLAFDPSRRPSAREVAAACEGLAERTDGPSLRRFCSERPWRDPIPQKGSLEGRELVEGELGLPSVERPSSAPMRPRLIKAANATIDPAAESTSAFPMDDPDSGDLVGAVMEADQGRIVAPDAFDRRRLDVGPTDASASAALGRGWLVGLGAVGCAAVIGVVTIGLTGALVLGWLAVR